jgi:hypothetical protein
MIQSNIALFRDLVWKVAMDLVDLVYSATKEMPRAEVIYAAKSGEPQFPGSKIVGMPEDHFSSGQRR